MSAHKHQSAYIRIKSVQQLKDDYIEDNCASNHKKLHVHTQITLVLHC